MKIEKIQSLQNQTLLEYLKRRGITKQTASPYVKEIYYQIAKTNSKKRYFALAFPNDSSGHELRNPYFKGKYWEKSLHYGFKCLLVVGLPVTL
jgi:hypothetical protein